MITLVLQCVYSVLALAAAATCLRVAARAGSGNAYHDAAWRLMGIGFLWHGTSDALQNVFGTIAWRAGNPSPELDAYLRWNQVMNHSRTFLLIGLVLGLVLLSVYPRSPDRRFWQIAIALLTVGFAVGIAVGLHEGRFTQERHYSAVAVWDVVELVTVFAALFALLVSNRADRLLWAFLSAYALGLALGVFWLAMFAQLKTGAWYPPIWTMPAMRNVLAAVMLAAAWRRLTLQRRGRPVHGMLGRPIAQLSTLH
jgi:hypothetical protein